MRHTVCDKYVFEHSLALSGSKELSAVLDERPPPDCDFRILPRLSWPAAQHAS